MGIFGWSYPPGCSGTPYDEEHPCDVCGEFPDTCICPECTHCGAIGDTRCYTPGHHVQTMERSPEQVYSLMWNEAHWENANYDENKCYNAGRCPTCGEWTGDYDQCLAGCGHEQLG